MRTLRTKTTEDIAAELSHDIERLEWLIERCKSESLLRKNRLSLLVLWDDLLLVAYTIENTPKAKKHFEQPSEYEIFQYNWENLRLKNRQRDLERYQNNSHLVDRGFALSSAKAALKILRESLT